MADQSDYPGMPGWVKVFGIIALVLVFVFIVVHVSGHGIGNHLPSGRPGNHAATGGSH